MRCFRRQNYVRGKMTRFEVLDIQESDQQTVNEKSKRLT